MDENNPLFDLFKIRIELTILNENEIPNKDFYENSLIFYLNKCFYKIITDNSASQNKDTKKNFDFYFFEFYTKNINLNSANIPDSNLLSNKTDFFCNIIMLVSDINEDEKNNIKKMLTKNNTQKDISFLFIFYKKNNDFNNYFDDFLDKNSYEMIELWENDDDIKKCYKGFENALKKIVIKYQINQLNQKIDISINENENKDGNASINKKLEILEIHLKLGNYSKSIEYLKILKESFIIPKELFIFKECEIIINFIKDYNNSFIDKNNYKLEYNKEIEKGFLDVIENYRNLRQNNLMANAYLKLLYYLTYFNTKTTHLRINEIIDNLINEKNINFAFFIYLNLAHIYNKINLKRKSFILLYMAYQDYKKNFQKNEKDSNPSYSHLLIKNIERYFFSKKYSSILNYYEYNYDTFKELSNIIKKNNYKPLKFTYVNENEKIDKNGDMTILKRTLYVNNALNGYYQILYKTKWEKIQKKIYSNLMKYYKSIKDYDKTLIYCFNLLQICHNVLSQEKQAFIIDIIKKKSKKIKYINYLNIVSIPFIIKIIPQKSEIKCDYQEKELQKKEDDLFIFNPWNKKYKNILNYYWTLNSNQIIIIKFYNPLKVSINIYDIQLIYRTKTENKNNCFSYSPNYITIPPEGSINYEFKFTPLIEDVYDIIGIEYYFEGVKIKQFIKKDGNGILFKYSNLVENLFNNKLKDKINLNKIKIYPAVPHIEFIPLNHDLSDNIESPLFLYEFQKYTFNFDIINNSDKPIKQIDVSIFAYKKDDYKITLYETIIKNDEEKEKFYLLPNNKKKFSYDFIQKKSYLKIEFIIYYIFDKKEEEQDINPIIKPYLYFKKNLHYKNLFIFSNPEYAPIHNNSNLEKIFASEKMYSNYIILINSSNFYFSFDIELLHFPNKKIFYEIINNDTSIEKGDFVTKKKFKIFLDTKKKLSKAYIKYKIDDISGIINCFDLIRNIFKINLEQNFDFDIKQIKKEEYYEFIYEIKNNTKFSFYNMKFKIILYQENASNINVNFYLKKDVFIDGNLIHIIDEIKPKETINIKVKIYPKKDIIFNTTFFLIDQKLKLLYAPSFFVKCRT